MLDLIILSSDEDKFLICAEGFIWIEKFGEEKN